MPAAFERREEEAHEGQLSGIGKAEVSVGGEKRAGFTRGRPKDAAPRAAPNASAPCTSVIRSASRRPDVQAASTPLPANQSPQTPRPDATFQKGLDRGPTGRAYRQRWACSETTVGSAAPTRLAKTSRIDCPTSWALDARNRRDQSGVACKVQLSGPVRPGLLFSRTARART